MRAARIHDYDRNDGLSIDDIEVPSISADQLLIRVAAASVNPVDWKVRDGMLRTGIVLDLPAILGGDVCGVVAAIGSDVRGFNAGDVVYTMTDTRSRYAYGGFAEYVAVNAANAAPKPSLLSAIEAAAVPLAALTAWQALHDEGRVRPGQRVLIHAAAGGVGGFAVQFAREAGAYVIGTASATNRDYVLRLGADEVIDYMAGPFEAEVSDIDLVIDLVGGDVQTRSLAMIKRGGTLINAWGALAADEAAAAGVTARKVAVAPNGDQLRRIGALIDAGRVAVDVAHVLPLDEAEAALALSRRGHGRGKIVLDVARIE